MTPGRRRPRPSSPWRRTGRTSAASGGRVAFLDAGANLLPELRRILVLVHGYGVLRGGLDQLVDVVRRYRDRALRVAREEAAIDVLACHGASSWGSARRGRICPR